VCNDESHAYFIHEEGAEQIVTEVPNHVDFPGSLSLVSWFWAHLWTLAIYA